MTKVLVTGTGAVCATGMTPEAIPEQTAERDGQASARLERVHETKAEKQRDRRRRFEVDDRFEPDASHRSEIAGARDAGR